MIDLVVGDEVVKLNSELTIGQYQALDSKSQFYKENPHQLISLFTGIPFNDIKNMSMETVKMIQAYLNNKMLKQEKKELVMTFEYLGVEYGLEQHFGTMPFGAWVDFEVYTADNITSNIHKLMAILYRPVTNRKKNGKYTIAPYNSNEIEERAELFRDLPASYWFASSDFFFQVANLYISNIKVSLESKRKMNQLIMKGWKKLPKWLQRKLPPDSILLSFTNSQEKMLQGLKK